MYFTLEQQRSMLQSGGVLPRNLQAVQAVQQRLKLTAAGAPIPVVSARFVEAAQ